MNRENNYLTPSVEMIELQIENPILVASGEDSCIDFGE